jgi:hypothetical protein
MTPSSPAVSIPAVEQVPPAVCAEAGKAKKRRRRRSAARRGGANLVRGEVLLLLRNDVEGAGGGTEAVERVGGERSEIMRRSVG